MKSFLWRFMHVKQKQLIYKNKQITTKNCHFAIFTLLVNTSVHVQTWTGKKFGAQSWMMTCLTHNDSLAKNIYIFTVTLITATKYWADVILQVFTWTLVPEQMQKFVVKKCSLYPDVLQVFFRGFQPKHKQLMMKSCGAFVAVPLLLSIQRGSLGGKSLCRKRLWCLVYDDLLAFS